MLSNNRRRSVWVFPIFLLIIILILDNLSSRCRSLAWWYKGLVVKLLLMSFCLVLGKALLQGLGDCLEVLHSVIWSEESRLDGANDFFSAIGMKELYTSHNAFLSCISGLEQKVTPFLADQSASIHKNITLSSTSDPNLKTSLLKTLVKLDSSPDLLRRILLIKLPLLLPVSMRKNLPKRGRIQNPNSIEEAQVIDLRPHALTFLKDYHRMLLGQHLAVK